MVAILDAIISVTRRRGESYKDFVLRAKKNPIGRAAKRADLEDNLNLDRIPGRAAKDIERCKKYRNALELLQETQVV